MPRNSTAGVAPNVHRRDIAGQSGSVWPRFGLGLAIHFLAKNGLDNGSVPPLSFAGPCLACCQPRLFSDIRRTAKCGVFCYNRPGCEVGEASFVEILLPSPRPRLGGEVALSWTHAVKAPQMPVKLGPWGPLMGDLPARQPPERPGAAPLAWGPEIGGPGNSSAFRISGFRRQFFWAFAQLPSATLSHVAASRFAGIASSASSVGRVQAHVSGATYRRVRRFRAVVRIYA